MPWDVPAYLAMLPAPLLLRLAEDQVATAVPGFTTRADLLQRFPDLHSRDALEVVCAVYNEMSGPLSALLEQRSRDRAFVDETTLRCAAENTEVPYLHPSYRTVLGAEDSQHRVVVGPSGSPVTPRPVKARADLSGPTITLFGPPDSSKMCINAMNAIHRRRQDEPDLVGTLVDESGIVPRWGADSEDSKTPLIADLLAATENLRDCYAGTLSYTDPRSGKAYTLTSDRPSIPVKRIPGLALPDGDHHLLGNPLPLHLIDLVLHCWLNRDCADALCFYVPKLENEEEAAYIAALVRSTERNIRSRYPAFPEEAVRLFIVFETPRAIFRIAEMADALFPYFAGGSLGWHDFLASTARLFRHDPNYRIPVKADPNIVIHHIRESHDRLREALDPIGAVKIGGMYGTLPEKGNAISFEVSMVGFIKDVVTQLRRGLDGFWVAHPDFVRIGIALVAAWHRGPDTVGALVSALITTPTELDAVRAFLAAPDVSGHDPADPLYTRRVLAADIEQSPTICNDDPEEVRYNVFQALQYLAAWLSGDGCVALPASLETADGIPVFVRVMDDLATTERSRWEVWAEIHHGRVSPALFDQILTEEMAFITAGTDTATKRIQVHLNDRTTRWYPIASRVLRQLVLSDTPVEAVPELTLPFTTDPIRNADDPWAEALRLCPGRYRTVFDC